MSSNDQIILDNIIKQRRDDLYPGMDIDEYFEIFSAEQSLKDYDLSDEELKDGIVSGVNDGGVDGFWILINGEYIKEDADISQLKKNINIDVIILQAKRGRGFKETAIEKLAVTSKDIFDLNNDEIALSRYNESLAQKIRFFSNIYKDLASKYPDLNIRYVYTSIANEINDKVMNLTEKIRDIVENSFSNAKFNFEFIGASDLIRLARRRSANSFQLPLAELPIASKSSESFICMVNIVDYFNFISDDKNKLRSNMFESNIRDYQGDTEVNKEIFEALKTKDSPEDFWWLNNGITIIATKATHSSKSISVENPQIVNGLQTSRQIFEYFRSSERKDDRIILVRLIVPNKPESIDRIIKATNSQTNIPPSSLWATNKLQRDIEEYLRNHDLYYDRRKNYYKNEGRNPSSIISISQMGQSVMSIVLGEPDNARARPSSLLKRPDDYERIFNDEYPIHVYYVSIYILKRVESYLKNIFPVDRRNRNNILFYVCREAAKRVTGQKHPDIRDISRINIDDITDDILKDESLRVMKIYKKLGGNDQIAKSPQIKIELESNNSPKSTSDSNNRHQLSINFG